MELMYIRLIFLIMLLLILVRTRDDRRLHRQWLSRHMNQLWHYFGFFNTQWQELKEDPDMFYQYTAMDLETFNKLLGLVSEYLQNNNQTALCPEEKLIITLRYLVSGDDLFSISLCHRISESTVPAVIKEVCEVLIRVLQPIYLRQPTEEEWKHIAISFLEQRNIPNCVGAFDCKHFQIRTPSHTGSFTYNHEGTSSIILFAVCDANHIFTLVHIGKMGSDGDTEVFSDIFGGQQLDLPKGVATLPGSNIATSCYFVGSDAFPLTTRIMKPYSGHFLPEDQRIFNYRSSRAHRVIQDAFELLEDRFRVLESPMKLLPESVDLIILATVCLQNFLKITEIIQNPPERVYDVSTFEENNHQLEIVGRAMRETLKNYFLTAAGEVPWQYATLHKTPDQWAEIDSMH